MAIGEYCNREVVIVDRETSIREAARLMRSHHVGDVIVADEREGRRVPVGILTDRDIVVELLADDVDLETVSVGDAMSFELLLAQEKDDLFETVQRMRNRGVRRIPVVNAGGSLEGVLTLDDLLEVLADQLGDMVSLVGNEQRMERKRRV